MRPKRTPYSHHPQIRIKKKHCLDRPKNKKMEVCLDHSKFPKKENCLVLIKLQNRKRICPTKKILA